MLCATSAKTHSSCHVMSIKTPSAKQVSTQFLPACWRSAGPKPSAGRLPAQRRRRGSCLFSEYADMCFTTALFLAASLMTQHPQNHSTIHIRRLIFRHCSVFTCWRRIGVHESSHFDSPCKENMTMFNWKRWFALRVANMTVKLAVSSDLEKPKNESQNPTVVLL